jgi:hypothetical protein
MSGPEVVAGGNEGVRLIMLEDVDGTTLLLIGVKGES